MMRVGICFCLLALLLAACSGGPTGREVVTQAQSGGMISFDIVKIDDAVVKTLSAHHGQSFADRFPKYTPPPTLKIGIGDTVAVLIFEGAGNGRFGGSLPERSRLQLGPAPDLPPRLGAAPLTGQLGKKCRSRPRGL
jgi:hypothetical protein